VLVLRHRRELLGAGGAANAARNMRALGARVTMLGAVGRDRNGRELLELLERDGIDVSPAVTIAGWTTPTKTRVLGAEPGRTPQQVLRIDREPEGDVPADARGELAGRLHELAAEVDAVLLSDYGYGLLGEELAGAAAALRARGATVVLDPRRSFALFRGIHAMSPNLGELALASRRSIEELSEPGALMASAHELCQRAFLEHVLVTLGNRGMLLVSRRAGGCWTVPAAGHEAVDVSGAGDTAAAAFTLALASGATAPQAMRLANAAASVVVMEMGAVPCALDKLRSALPVSPEPASAVGVRA
jgi:rfaE bifunctional protein kinase chain/domain